MVPYFSTFCADMPTTEGYLTLKYEGAGIILWVLMGNFFVPLRCKHPVKVFRFFSEYSGTNLHAKPCRPRSPR